MTPIGFIIFLVQHKVFHGGRVKKLCREKGYTNIAKITASIFILENLYIDRIQTF